MIETGLAGKVVIVTGAAQASGAPRRCGLRPRARASLPGTCSLRPGWRQSWPPPGGEGFFHMVDVSGSAAVTDAAQR
jgi:hypothetical protein